PRRSRRRHRDDPEVPADDANADAVVWREGRGDEDDARTMDHRPARGGEVRVVPDAELPRSADRRQPLCARRMQDHGLRDLRTAGVAAPGLDRKSTRLNSSHVAISYAVFCLKKKNFVSIIPSQ